MRKYFLLVEEPSKADEEEETESPINKEEVGPVSARYLVSSDLGRNVYLWDLEANRYVGVFCFASGNRKVRLLLLNYYWYKYKMVLFQISAKLQY